MDEDVTLPTKESPCNQPETHRCDRTLIREPCSNSPLFLSSVNSLTCGGELQDLPWEEMQKNRRFDLIYHAWQSAAKATRECISAILGISHGFRSPEDATRLSKHMLPSVRCIISDDRGRLKKLVHLANFIFTW